NESGFDMQLQTADGKIYRLVREGETFREAPLTPKQDWPMYDGSYSANRYSPLEQINTGNVKRLAPKWMFPVSWAPRLEATLVIRDLVYAVVAGGEEGARGFLDAYDIATGKRVWRFWTIPLPGEKLAETWVGSALKYGCGATWMSGSYDPQLDLLYWGVGNPCPDYNGDDRKGDNLYTNSMLALRPKTGELKWYFQFTPHDTHDWDAE